MPHDTAPARTGILRIDPDAAVMIPMDLDPADFQSPLPVQHYHMVYADDAIGLAVGIWDTTPMQEAFGPYPTDEFITVLQGSFDIVDGAGGAVTGAQGDSATFRCGIPVSWRQTGYLRKIYLTLIPPETEPPHHASAAGGVRVLPGHPPAAWGQARPLFRNDAGTMTVEFRAYPATSLPTALAPAHELCRILTGVMVLTDAAGQAQVFGPGDHVFLPAGTPVARDMRDGTSAYHVFVAA